MKAEKKPKPKGVFIRLDDALWVAVAKEALRLRISRTKLCIDILKKAIPSE